MFKKTGGAAPEIFLKDYTPFDFILSHTDLDIDIQDNLARVTSTLKLRRNPKSKNKNAPLVMQGVDLKLISIKINGKALGKKDYRVTPKDLTILNMPDKADLEIVATHNPYKNTTLAGLYASGSMLSTQCEAQGFRRITYYPDRPDVMSIFRTTIHADKKKFPVLLSNGNCVKRGADSKTRHYAVWEDPHLKPCYLFAMVAGTLDKVSTSFTTKSKRKVLIEIYVEPGKAGETGFALTAIKKAMKWDEDRFNLEYDLDRFMIVATPFFNMGAMENKGLNIFNDACVLGRSETASDGTISFIERVVGHEYFHNWTGDRITCRDWFQLSLKEGLTVFREQEFCGDVNSIPVERLGNVRVLRRAQWAEDSGAMAHPVRPDRYQAIDNFYTATVYEKGAEVVRMIQTLVGVKGFNRGMALYVKRHDGQAVTCDDFVKAMADANKIDLKQFMQWYSQAGTPVLTVTSTYDKAKSKLHLTIEQSSPVTPGEKRDGVKKKPPLHIPFAIGLLDAKGKDMIGTRILSVKKEVETYTFDNIKSKPVLSLLRDFSAPVRLVYSYSDEELLFLLAHDSDPFNRWEAGYKLLTKYLLNLASKSSAHLDLFAAYGMKEITDALGNVLRDPKLDAAFKTMVLALPSEGELGLALRAEGKLIDPDHLFAARKQMVKTIGTALRRDFEKTHDQLSKLSPTASDGVSMGKRSLKNLCLAYLAASDDEKILAKLAQQAGTSRNMTDQVAALGILSDAQTTKGNQLRVKALAGFEKRWSKSPTIMDKYLAVQAGSRREGVLKDVKMLMKHKAFDIKNPNRVSALIGSFAGNGMGFHAKDGSGYRFVADMIIKIDALNPQAGANLSKTFARWRDYDKARQELMKAELKRLSKHKLSANSSEIVTKSLKG